MFPVGIVGSGNAAEDVARLNAGLGCCRAGSDPFDGGGFDFDSGNLVDPAVVANHHHKGQNKVGHGTGRTDQDALPAGTGGESAGVVRWGYSGRAGGGIAEFGEVLAGHFDIAAQGKQADLIVGVAVLIAEEARAEAEGEGLDADPAEFGDGKVAELVDHDHDTDHDDKRNYSDKIVMKIMRDNGIQKVMKKISHKCAVITSIKRCGSLVYVSSVRAV